MGCYPLFGEVVLGVLAVAAGCLAASFSVYVARHTRDWLHYITATGSVIFVVGVVGQRAYAPTQNAGMVSACSAAGNTDQGIWGASLYFPILGIGVSPVAMAGLLVAAIGVCCVLLFERVTPVTDEGAAPSGVLEDLDTV